MKISICLSAFMLICKVAFSAPTPAYQTVTEPFYNSATTWGQLDRADAVEAIYRQSDTAFPESTSFAWGGFDAGTGHTVAIDNTLHPTGEFLPRRSVVIFNLSANVAGSYAYTRFDTSTTDFVAGAKSPSKIVNASAAGAKISLKIYNGSGETLAVMIRDNTTWWRSSGKTVPTVSYVSGPLGSMDYEFAGPNAVAWTRIDNTTGGGKDMDDVDNDGEGALVFGAVETPNLAAIEGMGLTVINGTGSAWLGIDEMSLIGPTPLAGVKDWRKF